MEFIRVFVNPRRSMQRLGFLKHLLLQASRSATNSLSSLGKDLIAVVTRKVPVLLTPDLKQYINKGLTSSQYRDLRSAVLRPSAENQHDLKVNLEIQDLYLADPRIPSRRGRLVTDSWNRYPYCALDLGLIRKGTYSLLVRGHSFLSLVSNDEKGAFILSSNSLPGKETNPLVLTMQQKIHLLFSIVDGDGDLLKPLYRNLLSASDDFTDKEAGDYLPEIYRLVARESKSKVRSGDDLIRIQQLLNNAAKIEAVKRSRSPGGKNPREHAITIRLEPFVEIGLLAKLDPFAYRYQATTATKQFFRSLISCENIAQFLEGFFFKTTSEALGLQAKEQRDSRTVLPAIHRAYTILRSPLGYAPITEVALLAAIFNLTEVGSYFEISDAKQILKSLQKERPETVGFNVDRWGALAFVKLNLDSREWK